MTADAAALRASLPKGFGLIGAEPGKDGLKLTLSIPADWQVRDFSDETGLVVDLLKPAKPPTTGLTDLEKPQQPAAAEGAQHAAAPAETKPAAAAAPVPAPQAAKAAMIQRSPRSRPPARWRSPPPTSASPSAFPARPAAGLPRCRDDGARFRHAGHD